MWKVEVFVTLKPGVLDPQGQEVKNSLHKLGYEGVKEVRIGRYIELELANSPLEEVERDIQEMCGKLLANPVIESYRYQLQEV